jgi:hypothetical protein
MIKERKDDALCKSEGAIWQLVLDGPCEGSLNDSGKEQWRQRW